MVRIAKGLSPIPPPHWSSDFPTTGDDARFLAELREYQREIGDDRGDKWWPIAAMHGGPDRIHYHWVEYRTNPWSPARLACDVDYCAMCEITFRPDEQDDKQRDPAVCVDCSRQWGRSLTCEVDYCAMCGRTLKPGREQYAGMEIRSLSSGSVLTSWPDFSDYVCFGCANVTSWFKRYAVECLAMINLLGKRDDERMAKDLQRHPELAREIARLRRSPPRRDHDGREARLTAALAQGVMETIKLELIATGHKFENYQPIPLLNPEDEKETNT
jgi:hypothetical protein